MLWIYVDLGIVGLTYPTSQTEIENIEMSTTLLQSYSKALVP